MPLIGGVDEHDELIRVQLAPRGDALDARRGAREAPSELLDREHPLGVELVDHRALDRGRRVAGVERVGVDLLVLEVLGADAQ